MLWDSYLWSNINFWTGQLPLHGTVTCGWTGILIDSIIREIQRFTTGDVYYGIYTRYLRGHSGHMNNYLFIMLLLSVMKSFFILVVMHFNVVVVERFFIVLVL